MKTLINHELAGRNESELSVLFHIVSRHLALTAPLLAGAPERAVRIDEVVVKRRKAIKRTLAGAGARDWRSSPLAYPRGALVLFEFFDAAFNDLGEAYGAAFPLRGLV
jgi:hypothetical protein